ncbi:MAG: DUF2288 domain-containing protein [Gammaproteobacteria bacterium]|nr:DUF2288 domain-containing protein [Gammaproteobacteria bacterium]
MRQKLNLETGKLSWPELARHFARGVVIVISPELDLIEVAAVFSKDEREQVENWLHRGLIHRAMDDDARRWEAQNPCFWSTVVAPWVLVQETDGSDTP